MEKLNYFNYCAWLVLLVMLISVIERKIVKGKLNQSFLVLVLIAIASVTFDIWAVYLDGLGTFHPAASFIAHSGYLVLHNLSTPMYVRYMIALTDTWHIYGKKRVLRVLLVLPFLIVSVFTIVNLFQPYMFYFEGNGVYVRGPLFWMYYVSAVLYMAFGLYYLMRYRKLFTKERFAALLTMFPMIGGAALVQMLLPRAPIEMFAHSIGLLVIFMIIQRPEERIELITGFGRSSAYAAELKRAFINKKPMQLILINIENYHSIYDILGYDGTGYMLKMMTGKILEIQRRLRFQADFYYVNEGRYSIVLDEQNFSKTEQAAERFNEVLREHFTWNFMDINPQIHICIVKCPEDINDFETLNAFAHDFSSVDYTGEILQASSVMQKNYYNIMRELDTIIENALANRYFSVYYQPIYSVQEQRFNSAEALLRLKDKKYGFISPELFIPAAEKSGAIHRISEFVLDEVCKFIASEEYRELGLDYIEVNLSVAQCMQKKLTDTVMKTLNKYNVRPEQVNLEITETAASNSQRIMNENIHELTEAGFTLSLDDFGTGYSNMQRVASLPLTLVKLDKTFTKIEDNANMSIIVQNTIRMIKAMHMKIVVEGIETEPMMRQFSDFECEYIQGYYYSKPIPREEFVRFIRNEKEKYR